MCARRLFYAAVAALVMAGTLRAAEPDPAVATCPADRDFAGKDLTDRNFHSCPPGWLRDANFEKAILKGAAFEGQDLTGANFKGADLGPSQKGPATFAKAILERTVFAGAVMNATDFTFARFICTDFSDTSLLLAEFGPSQDIEAGNNCRTNFTRAVIDVNAIDTAHWGKTDFTDADFKNVSPQTFSLAGADITNARLAGANFSGIDMSRANLTGVDLRNAKLIKARMPNTALNGIDLSGTDLSMATLTCARFFGTDADDKDNPNKGLCTETPVSTAPRVAAKLTKATLAGADLTNATLNAAVLRGASLAGAMLRRASFIDAWLEPEGNVLATSLLGADLTSANFTRAHVNQVQFNNVLLSMAVFDDTTLNGTSFFGSIMPQTSFSQSILQSVSFYATILQGAKFRGTTMQTTPQSQGTGVNFTCAHLGGADFTNAKVFSADFTAAVMPPRSQCCLQTDGTYYCGMIDGLQKTYGAVEYPVLSNAMNCPNGVVAQCKDEASWTIPRWETNLCNQKRAMETVWRKPDCGTSPSDYVVFEDKKLETCILETLPGARSGVALATAKQITHVSCPGRGITSTGGLEKFDSLVSLDLTGNLLAVFELPAALPLQTVKIGGNRLTRLNLLNKGIVRLDASNNALTSLTADPNINFLVLDLARNELSSFDVAIQDDLVYADLSFNKLTNVLDDRNPSLKRQTHLTFLDLSHNSLTTIGSATSIAYNSKTEKGTLESLFLACNAGFTCNTLSLTGDHKPYQTSACADPNPATGQWIARDHPNCPSRRQWTNQKGNTP